MERKQKSEFELYMEWKFFLNEINKIKWFTWWKCRKWGGAVIEIQETFLERKWLDQLSQRVEDTKSGTKYMFFERSRKKILDF